MRHTFWSYLIRCANTKRIRLVLWKIQSGHDFVHRWTDGRTDRRTENVKPVYTPFNFFEAGGIMKSDICPTLIIAMLCTTPQNVFFSVILYFITWPTLYAYFTIYFITLLVEMDFSYPYPWFQNMTLMQTGGMIMDFALVVIIHPKWEPIDLKVEAETKWTTFRKRHFQTYFLHENVWISIKISLKFVPKGPINNIPAYVQIMAWRRQATSHYLNQCWSVYRRIYASLGLNELRALETAKCDNACGPFLLIETGSLITQ